MKNLIKTLRYFVFVQILSICIQTVAGQAINSEITDALLIKSIGVWNGSLMVETTELPLVFKVLKSDPDDLKVTLDSPLQNAYDIPLGDISNNSGELKIDAPDLQAYYTGKFMNDSTLNGTWHQAGNTYPLKLVKSSTAD